MKARYYRQKQRWLQVGNYKVEVNQRKKNMTKKKWSQFVCNPVMAQRSAAGLENHLCSHLQLPSLKP